MARNDLDLLALADASLRETIAVGLAEGVELPADASSSSSRRSGIRGCHWPDTGRITAPGSSWPQSTRIVQLKRRPTSKVDSMMVLGARRK
jgi:hypothetical protein